MADERKDDEGKNDEGKDNIPRGILIDNGKITSPQDDVIKFLNTMDDEDPSYEVARDLAGTGGPRAMELLAEYFMAGGINDEWMARAYGFLESTMRTPILLGPVT